VCPTRPHWRELERSSRYPPSALNVMVDEMVRTVIDAASPAQKKRLCLIPASLRCALARDMR
jgi:hypothetical protein